MTKNCHGGMIRHLACFLDTFKAREGIRNGIKARKVCQIVTSP